MNRDTCFHNMRVAIRIRSNGGENRALHALIPSNSCCHGTSKDAARAWLVAIASSVLRGAIKEGSRLSSLAA